MCLCLHVVQKLMSEVMFMRGNQKLVFKSRHGVQGRLHPDPFPRRGMMASPAGASRKRAGSSSSAPAGRGAASRGRSSASAARRRRWTAGRGRSSQAMSSKLTRAPTAAGAMGPSGPLQARGRSAAPPASWSSSSSESESRTGKAGGSAEAERGGLVAGIRGNWRVGAAPGSGSV